MYNINTFFSIFPPTNVSELNKVLYIIYTQSSLYKLRRRNSHLVTPVNLEWPMDYGPCTLANVKKVAVSSTARDVTFYDCAGSNFERQFVLCGLDDCVISMDYWYDPRDINRAYLLLGKTIKYNFDPSFVTVVNAWSRTVTEIHKQLT